MRRILIMDLPIGLFHAIQLTQPVVFVQIYSSYENCGDVKGIVQNILEFSSNTSSHPPCGNSSSKPYIDTERRRKYYRKCWLPYNVSHYCGSIYWRSSWEWLFSNKSIVCGCTIGTSIILINSRYWGGVRSNSFEYNSINNTSTCRISSMDKYMIRGDSCKVCCSSRHCSRKSGTCICGSVSGSWEDGFLIRHR